MNKHHLMAPGPTPVPHRVLEAMARPLIHHRTREFEAHFEGARRGLEWLFQTSGDVITLAASGSGGMEAAVANLLSPGDSALVIEGGKFGERWTELCAAYGVEADVLEVEWGRSVDMGALEARLERGGHKALLMQASETSTGAKHDTRAVARVVREKSPDTLVVVDAITALGVYDLKAEEWDLDVVITGSQKALMLPPGLAFVWLSERAWRAAPVSTSPKYYFDLNIERKSQMKNTTAWTPAISLLAGLPVALDMMREEGLENVFATACAIGAGDGGGRRGSGSHHFSPRLEERGAHRRLRARGSGRKGDSPKNAGCARGDHRRRAGRPERQDFPDRTPGVCGFLRRAGHNRRAGVDPRRPGLFTPKRTRPRSGAGGIRQMSQTFRVLICEPLSSRAHEILEEQKGFEVLNHTSATREEILEAVKTADALIVRSGTQVDDELLGVGETLKVVARAGIGVDNVDLEAASVRGILVVNAPDGNVITTAEHTIAMMFSLARKIPSAVSSLKGGKWERSRFVGSELSSKTLGVVGMGRVGSQTATFARSLGMNVLAYDPYISAEVLSKRGVSPVDFEELLAKSDYITLHVPKTTETGNLIGAEEIARMRDGVRIINCARGGLIDEKALAEALDSGKVGGVAVDVYQQEPPDPNDPLIGRDDVVCTPHLGASTAEAQENVATSVAKQVVAYLTEGVVGHAVNLPSLSPEMLEQIGPHLDLADRLGDFLAQLAGGGLQTLEVVYGGAIDMPMKALAASAIKGMLGRFLSSVRVNMVNGLLLAKERGIEVRATSRSENLLYTDLIELRVKTDSGERSVAGTFLRKNDPRIVRIDDYSVDVALRGYLLIFRNEDRPGLIGKMGTLLGNNNINIAGMQLGRVWQQDMAVAVLILDDPVPEPVMEEVRAIPHVYDAFLVRLGFS